MSIRQILLVSVAVGAIGAATGARAAGPEASDLTFGFPYVEFGGGLNSWPAFQLLPIWS